MTDEELATLTQKAGLWTSEKGFTKEWLLRSSRALLARPDPLSITDREALDAILERSGRKDPESTLMEEFMANVLRKAYPPPEEKDAPTSTEGSMTNEERTTHWNAGLKKAYPPLEEKATSPLTLDPQLSTYLKAAGFSIPTFGDIDSIWLSNLAMIILRKGTYTRTRELTALAAILKHLLGDDGSRKVYKDIQRFLEMKENP